MKISAVISEFNPFHNGHSYLISQTKQNSDAVICIMSGAFVQRGDAAIFDKFIRAEAAVRNGADLVIELPVVFAASTAERFAFGAVNLAKNLGCVDEIVFGSESGDIDKLTAAAKLLFNEPPEISEKIKQNLADGFGYPVSRKMAFSKVIDSDILENPNNILAIEYIKASMALNYNVKFKTLQRIGDYHSTETIANYASATAIRQMITANKDYSQFVPRNTISLYENADTFNLSNLDNTIIYLLRSCNAEYIKEINDVSEGLENALKDAGRKYTDMFSVVNAVCGKRYTKTKISRILISLLLGIDKKIIFETPEYARILSFNTQGRKIIKQLKGNIQTIVKVADFTEKSNMFEKDLLASDIASLCCKNKKESGIDYRTPPIYISE